MQLDPIAVAAGVKLVALAATSSTNTEARQRLGQGERGPLWITAETQTQGRGRMDRSWVSPPGNLYASLLLTDPSPPERAPELSFVTALAVRDAILAAAPALAPKLVFKWPNDLLLDGKKCAGILIEGEVAPNKGVATVIGIGVNCISHPQTAPDRPATDFAACGAGVTPEELLKHLSAAMCRRLSQWDRGANFPAMLADWIAAARGIGEEITVKNGTGEKRGRFTGLDASGRLLLELLGGTVEKIAAGDVFPFDIGSH
ncbi:MAG TPA: biotin--[acetyl-CoA-carboxylase] ligase [Xanthobacteraceae bacterium]|jgi:BirA family biotin operon repressor/biotin-[acetyl-CoA-carboxylase] ligase|nr:biotin--[acetyl-CoA-carboxylase] ligase [Xanthobacteraceae bacterium]